MASRVEEFYDLSKFRSLSIVRKDECWELEILMDAESSHDSAVIGSWSACLDAPDVKLTGIWVGSKVLSYAIDLGATLTPDPQGIFYAMKIVERED